ncbi:hypothetical protein DLJ49_06705 [Rhodovulum sp. 12E13]|nr:hypothetical protein DLJ49_06705 [Rhodovulum sp. 12E13]
MGAATFASPTHPAMRARPRLQMCAAPVASPASRYTSSSFTEPNMDDKDSSDFVFRTYMQPAVIPLPPALALLPLALGGLFCLRRRGEGRGRDA